MPSGRASRIRTIVFHKNKMLGYLIEDPHTKLIRTQSGEFAIADKFTSDVYRCVADVNIDEDSSGQWTFGVEQSADARIELAAAAESWDKPSLERMEAKQRANAEAEARATKRGSS